MTNTFLPRSGIWNALLDKVGNAADKLVVSGNEGLLVGKLAGHVERLGGVIGLLVAGPKLAELGAL